MLEKISKMSLASDVELKNKELARAAELLDWYHSRPPSRRELDQFPATVCSILNQVLFMLGQLKDKIVVIFGDHDGSSLPIARYCSPKRVFVFEIDDYTVRWLRKIVDHSGLPIEVIEHDLRRPSVGVMNLVGSVDVVRIDPPYNCAGITLWAIRAAQIMSESSDLFICLPAGSDWALHVSYKAREQILPELGFSQVGEGSEYLNSYPQVEGMASDFRHFKLVARVPIQDVEFPYDIYHTSEKFCIQKMKCKSYLRCTMSRENWKKTRWAVFTQLNFILSV